jgi:hypothetical protein
VKDFKENIENIHAKIFSDSIIAGILLGLALIGYNIGASSILVGICVYFLGIKSQALVYHFKVIKWIEIIQSQDAVIDQLLTQVEKTDKLIEDHLSLANSTKA